MMAKRYTYPDLFDEVRQIDVAWLRELGYLEGSGRRSGTLSWERGSSVSIDAYPEHRFLNLTYWLGDERRAITVRLETKVSNLGKGMVWFFICPATGRRCRKLYGINGSFYSRHAYPWAMYRSQVEPKKDRGLRKYITLAGTTKNPKAEWDNFGGKRFQAFYNGKPTKRYLDYLRRRRRIAELLQSGAVRRAFELPRRFRDKFRL